MKDNEIAKDYYSRVKKVVNQLRAYRENIYKKKVVEKILICCTEKYDALITITKEFKDIEKLSATKLMGSLKAYEYRLSWWNESSLESAF